MKTIKRLGVIVLIGAVSLFAVGASADGRTTGRSTGPVVFVESQGLFFDTIVLGELPPIGEFQLLKPGGPSGLATEFGPGDVGYLGGRWWMDVNGNDVMDDGDMYFMCPLLGPGRGSI